MFIDDYDDYIEKITLQKELENVKEQFKAVKDANAKLKTEIDLHCKANAEKTEKIKRLSEELDSLKYTNLILRTNAATWRLNLGKDDNEDKIKSLEAKIEMLESDRKDSLKTCGDCSHKFGTRVKGLEAVIERLNEEKQQEGDNLRNRIKDLESEIDELKKNPSAAPDAEWIAIHTADVETINKLNIQVHDLNNTITTLLDRLSKSTDENQELNKKVQELKDIIKDLGAKLYK